jgi:ribosomal protein S18 acetylase RimI-like enzyme
VPNFAIVPHSYRAISPGAVVGLYRIQGWWPERTAEQVAAALDNGPAVGAWQGDDLVGFARAVTDGVLRAYLEDVIVAPDFRNVGLGRALMMAILDLLQPISVVTLFCSRDHVSYYEAAGFTSTAQVVLHRT